MLLFWVRGCRISSPGVRGKLLSLGLVTIKVGGPLWVGGRRVLLVIGGLGLFRYGAVGLCFGVVAVVVSLHVPDVVTTEGRFYPLYGAVGWAWRRGGGRERLLMRVDMVCV